MNRFLFGLSAVLTLFCARITPALSQDVTFYVNPTHPNASDHQPGTPDAPLATLQEAADRTITNKRAFTSTRVLIAPGTYREFVDLQTWTNFDENVNGGAVNATPMWFEAEFPGSVVISGSEVYTNWTRQSDGRYTHPWTHNWGVYPNPTGGARAVADIVRRREMVFVNGERLTQVLSQNDLNPGAFMVDEAQDLLYIALPDGIDPNETLVEVGIREHLWTQEYENHVTLRGLIFEHAATHWADAVAGVRLSGSNHMLIEDCTFRQNNGMTLYMGELEDITLRRVKMNHNGWDGWGPWRVKNFVAEDTETSYNNWRGHLGGFYGWSVGNKIESTHGITIRRHEAIGNFGRGLWLDLDNEHVLLEDVTLRNNLSDAIFIEANQGPIRITRSLLCNNGGYGILAANSENVTLDQNTLCENTLGELHITGDDWGRWVQNWETGESVELAIKDWVLQTNTIDGFAPYLIDTTLGSEAWNTFVSTLDSDYNTWHHLSRMDVFEIAAEQALTFGEWQVTTGADQHSNFGLVPLVVELTRYAVDVEEDAATLYWTTATETDNAGFEVHLQADGDRAWETLAFIEGAGTTSTPQTYSYRVADLAPGLYRLRLKQIDLDGTITYSPNLEAQIGGIPEALALGTAYPNPFNRETAFTLAVEKSQQVDVTMFDVAGRQVQRVFEGRLPSGVARTFTLAAGTLPSGLYLYRVTGEDFAATGQVMLVR